MFSLSAPASLAAAKAQAQGAAQGVAQQVASSDAAKAVRAGADSVGLGDELSALDAEVGDAIGLPAPSCPEDQIDHPTISKIPVSSADNPIDAQTTMDSFFSYVVIDSKHPSETEQKQKTNGWYISLASAGFFVGLSILYSRLK
jgi:hypothetical protein